MTRDDVRRFSVVMTGMAETFGSPLSDAGLEIRFAALAEYSIEQVEQACVACIKSRQYSSMPTVAEIIDHIGGGRVEDRAEVEAARVVMAVKDLGSYRNVVFDDPTTMAVIDGGFGGWVNLCAELMEDQVKFFLRDFARMYCSYARRGVKSGGVLEGRGAGHPVFVGDGERCRAVMAIPRLTTGISGAGEYLGDGLNQKRLLGET